MKWHKQDPADVPDVANIYRTRIPDSGIDHFFLILKCH